VEAIFCSALFLFYTREAEGKKTGKKDVLRITLQRTLHLTMILSFRQVCGILYVFNFAKIREKYENNILWSRP
jgi:hypothetical protein